MKRKNSNFIFIIIEIINNNINTLMKNQISFFNGLAKEREGEFINHDYFEAEETLADQIKSKFVLCKKENRDTYELDNLKEHIILQEKHVSERLEEVQLGIKKLQIKQ